MKINYRILHRWWVERLLKQKPANYKYKNETDDIRSKCIAFILAQTKTQYARLVHLEYKLNRRTVEHTRHRIHRDEFGKETVVPDPVFTANEGVQIASKWAKYLFLLLIFAVAETWLYILTASMFMPNSSSIAQIGTGAFFAIGFMFTIGYSFEIKQNYLKACDLSKPFVTENDMKWWKYKLHFTYAFLICCVIALLLAGCSRIYYFAGIDPKGMTDGQYHNKFMASKFAALMTLLFTVVISFFAGFIKNEFSKVHVLFRQFNAWRRNQTIRDRCTQEFHAFARHVLHVAQVSAEEYWQWVIEIKRVFLEAEYDAKYEELHAEYWKLRSTDGFIVTDSIYRKFAMLQSAYEELFRYGIIHDPAIWNRIQEAADIMRVPEAHVKEHLRALEEAKIRAMAPMPSQNGSAKNQTIFNSKNNTDMKSAAIIIALCAATSLFSCHGKSEKQQVNMVTAIDISASRTPSVLSFYKAIEADNILPHIGPRDSHCILPIDAGSVQSGEEIAIEDFSRNDYYNEFAGQDAAQATMRIHKDSLRTFRTRFLASFDSAVSHRKKLSGSTDIIGAISQAKKYVMHGRRNVMIILSDMLLYQNYGNGTLDFEHNLNDTSDMRKFFSVVPRINLEGWDVLVITGSQDIPAAKFMLVQKFWERWFKLCRADLIAYTSGSVSLAENALAQ